MQARFHQQGKVYGAILCGGLERRLQRGVIDVAS
jgi:hypothetical protein